MPMPTAASAVRRSAFAAEHAGQRHRLSSRPAKSPRRCFRSAGLTPASSGRTRPCEDVRTARPAGSSCATPGSSTASKLTAAKTLRVPLAELEAAHAAANPAFLETLRRVRQSIMSFQLGLLHGDATLSVPGQHELRMRYRPMRRVGICIPEAAAYPSTLAHDGLPGREPQASRSWQW